MPVSIAEPFIPVAWATAAIYQYERALRYSEAAGLVDTPLIGLAVTANSLA